MNSAQPTVSIIIPCRNEEKFIGKVLENILQQDYPQQLIDVYLADGMSTDKTAEIIKTFAAKYPSIHYLINEQKTVPFALNKAIQQSKGQVVIRLDAHAEYPNDYVSVLVRHLYSLNADNVGGVWITLPQDNSAAARAIAIATSHPVGIGNAQYKMATGGPVATDTVPYGCYRREVFEKIGLFDEQLMRNQDDEFNARLVKHGGKIFLIPSVKIKYYARRTVQAMAKMFYQYGYFKPLVNAKIGYPATMRQLAPPGFVLVIMVLAVAAPFSCLMAWALAGLAGVYALAIGLTSVSLASKNGWSILPQLLLVFPAIHFSYGLGYLKGIIDFMLLKKHTR